MSLFKDDGVEIVPISNEDYAQSLMRATKVAADKAAKEGTKEAFEALEKAGKISNDYLTLQINKAKNEDDRIIAEKTLKANRRTSWLQSGTKGVLFVAWLGAVIVLGYDEDEGIFRGYGKGIGMILHHDPLK